MKEVKIDERSNEVLCIKSLNIVELIMKEIDILGNEESDIFFRYMAFMRLSSFCLSFHHQSSLLDIGYRMGFDMHDPLLQSKEAISHGWDEVKLKNNPFFEQEDQEREERLRGMILELSEDDLSESMKEKISKIIKNKIHAEKNRVH